MSDITKSSLAPKTPHPISPELRSALFGPGGAARPLTKTQQAYAAIRQAIVSHDLPAGTPLDEHLLNSTFTMGRTPVREALKTLATEHLLVWNSHQAPSIRDVGLFELSELYLTRRVIEIPIARLAAERRTDADLRRIDERDRQLRSASEAGDVYTSVEMDFALHVAIAESTQNRFLVEASRDLNLQSLRIWYRAQRALGIENVPILHSQLVGAIRDQDLDLVEQLANLHIDNSLKRQQAVVSPNGGPPIDIHFHGR